MLPSKSHRKRKSNDEHLSTTRNNFVSKLFRMLQMLEAERNTTIVCWQPHGKAFRVNDHNKFETLILPRFFRHSKMSSFQRQLNIYNFHRISSGRDQDSYYHSCFIRDQPELLCRIHREATKGHGVRQPDMYGDPPDFYNDNTIERSPIPNEIPSLNQPSSSVLNSVQLPVSNLGSQPGVSVEQLLLQLLNNNTTVQTSLGAFIPMNSTASLVQQIPQTSRNVHNQNSFFGHAPYVQLVATTNTTGFQPQLQGIPPIPFLNNIAPSLIANQIGLQSYVSGNIPNNIFHSNILRQHMGQPPHNSMGPMNIGPGIDHRGAALLSLQLNQLLANVSGSQQSPTTGGATTFAYHNVHPQQQQRQPQTTSRDGQQQYFQVLLDQLRFITANRHQQQHQHQQLITSDSATSAVVQESNVQPPQETEVLVDIANLLTQRLQYHHSDNNSNEINIDTATATVRVGTNLPSSSSAVMQATINNDDTLAGSNSPPHVAIPSTPSSPTSKYQ